MELRQAAEKYRRLAQDIMASETERFDTALPDGVQRALLRLYRAKQLEARLEKCEPFLSEETDEQTVRALDEAAQAIEAIVQDALEVLEGYGQAEPDFARQMDALSMAFAGSDARTLLFKLYKCESIIAAAYRFAAAQSYMLTPEQYIRERMDIDIDALLDMREALLGDIAAALTRLRQ